MDPALRNRREKLLCGKQPLSFLGIEVYSTLACVSSPEFWIQLPKVFIFFRGDEKDLRGEGAILDSSVGQVTQWFPEGREAHCQRCF